MMEDAKTLEESNYIKYIMYTIGAILLLLVTKRFLLKEDDFIIL